MIGSPSHKLISNRNSVRVRVIPKCAKLNFFYYLLILVIVMSSLSYSCKNTSEMPMNFFNVSKFDFEQVWTFYIKNKTISICYTPSPVNIMNGYVEEENSFMLELEEIKLPRNEWIYFTHTLKINGEFRDRTEGYINAVADGDEDIVELKFK